MNIKSFYGVKVRAFFLVAEYLHGVFYGSKCVYVVVEVFSEF
jgi:hypothetical protein